MRTSVDVRFDDIGINNQTTMSTPPRFLFLGLDLSTQQLKATIIDKASNIVHEASVHFDRDLAHHRTTNGAIRGPDAGEVTSPIRMWLEAIDLVCKRLRDNHIDFGDIVAISGAGQVSFVRK